MLVRAMVLLAIGYAGLFLVRIQYKKTTLRVIYRALTSCELIIIINL